MDDKYTIPIIIFCVVFDMAVFAVVGFTVYHLNTAWALLGLAFCVKPES